MFWKLKVSFAVFDESYEDLAGKIVSDLEAGPAEKRLSWANRKWKGSDKDQ